MEKRKQISLNGEWDFQIPFGRAEKRRVPGSYHCVGDSTYHTTFDCARPQKSRVLLVFEGIAYQAKPSVNGKTFETMLPYSRYTFDITDVVKAEGNDLTVQLKDINAPFGPAEGWCNYGGIVRAVYLLVVPDLYIRDVFFHADLNATYDAAACTAEVTLSAAAAADTAVEVTLAGHGTPIVTTATVKAGSDKVDVVFDAAQPELWSTDYPALYELTTRLVNGCDDELTQTVGFKKLEIENNRFKLNGQPIFIHGVCRHDLLDDKTGFSESDEQLEKDFRMIKALGVNYVRLVHYPHDPRVLAMADKLGLMVSEESGLWWSNMKDPFITGSALQVMEHCITRDRSHVSVAFWLGFNECDFTEEYLRDSAAVCRRLDPSRMVSGANCFDVKRTHDWFSRNGLDFYTMHPYGPQIDFASAGMGNDYPYGRTSIREILKNLNDKPVIFTEWGGWNVDENPALFEQMCDHMYDCYLGKDGLPALAGMSYWAWSDMYEYNRGNNACIDGIQIEGLVHIDRTPKTNYFTYQKCIAKHKCPPIAPSETIVIPVVREELVAHPVAMPDTMSDKRQCEAWDAAVEDSRHTRNLFNKKTRRIDVGPVLPEAVRAIGSLKVALDSTRPIVINGVCPSMEIPVNQRGSKLFFIGNALFTHGYPTYGAAGDPVGAYDIVYTDGSVQTVALRNGAELVTVGETFGPTRIDPRAAFIQPAIRFSYDKNHENYQINLFETAVDPQKTIQKVIVRKNDEDYCLLLYGMTVTE